MHSRIVRFLVSGGTGFATQISVMFVLTDVLGWWYLFSFVAAFLVAQAVSFTLQKFFTFRDGTLGARRVSGQAIAYISLGVFNLAANAALLFCLVEYVGFHYLFAQAIVSVVIAVWSYVFYKYLFREVSTPVLDITS